MTHLFADGGRIIKSNKTNYAEHVDKADMAKLVRRMMKEQHKAMFIALRGGEFDDPIEAVCGPHPEPLKRPTRAAMSAVPTTSPSMVGMDAVKTPISAPTSSQLNIESSKPSHPRPPPPPSSREASEPSNPKVRPPGPARKLSNPSLRRVSAPASSSLYGGEIDFDSIERAAKEAASRESFPDIEQKPPVESEPPGNRYAEAKPASIFEEEPQSRSLFDEEGINEKSLDEVILSYLAEDLESPPQGQE